MDAKQRIQELTQLLNDPRHAAVDEGVFAGMVASQLGGDGVDVAMADLMVQIPAACRILEPVSVGDGISLKKNTDWSVHDVSSVCKKFF